MTIFDIFQNGISGGVISGARKGFKPSAPKIRVGSFVKGGRQPQVMYQFTRLFSDHATQENRSAEDAAELCETLLRDEGYAQAVLFSREADWHITCYGRLKIRKQPPTHADADAAAGHDREKPSLIPLDAPFVKPLGLDRAQYADKLRQIEMYLQLALSVIPEGDAPLKMVDFGCGRAYLTFAMYWYVTAKLGRGCEIVGVDLKENVIAEASELANTLGFGGLKFYAGDAENFDPGAIDTVFTLHACDLATDYALAWAVRRGAQSIVSVPCCQHELFSQLKSDTQNPLLRGIIRERTASLVTDAARAQLLEGFGYKVEAVEFVDAEHTPKNIMLRARKVRSAEHPRSVEAREGYLAFVKAWGADPAIGRLLGVGADEVADKMFHVEHSTESSV